MGIISAGQLAQLAAAYSTRNYRRVIPEMAESAAVARALGLPDISVLRIMLAREPVVCLQRL